MPVLNVRESTMIGGLFIGILRQYGFTAGFDSGFAEEMCARIGLEQANPNPLSPVDIILPEFRSSRINGFDAFRRVKCDAFSLAVPIVMVTVDGGRNPRINGE